MTQSSPYRLPPNVRPTAYRLTLTPDLENFTFTGHVSIDLQVSEDTGRVLLNAAELEITAASVTDAYGGPMPASGILLDEKRERVFLTFPREIATGRATLSMEFSGILNDQLRGFYRCRYTDADGAERNMAATQFEATDARRAFPCWDEPAAKATFELTLRIPSELIAVSNTMPEAETPAENGTKEVLFAPTPKMSTYLLAFIVGDLAAVEERAPNGTLVRIWATRGKEEQGRFALETAVDLLAYLDFYFGIPYPLEKLDHLALPDFAAGAMENWGLLRTGKLPSCSTRPTPPPTPASALPKSLLTRWHICGLAILSPWSGGTTSGSTRASPPGWGTRPWTTSARSGTCGRSSSTRTPTAA